tara:strand:- start:16953 stop:17876 length:924 start_codon:yes stop_codon:yes gene_type:complete
MNNINNNSNSINFKDLLKVFWNKKITIILICTFFLIISSTYSLSLADRYKSEAILAPTSSSSSNLSSMASKYSGVASLAGISIPSNNEVNKVDMGVEIIKSLNFFEDFINKNDLFLELQAAKGWDSSSNKLIFDSNIYNEAQKKWVSKEKFSLNGKPSIQSAHRNFIENLDIFQDPNTNFVTISFEHYSPYVSKKVLDLIIHDINYKTKNEDIQVAQRTIDFLEKEAAKTQLSSILLAINNLIEQQIEVIALANASPEYLLKKLSDPNVSELKASPNRMLIVLLSLIFGALVSCSYILLNYDFKRVR